MFRQEFADLVGRGAAAAVAEVAFDPQPVQLLLQHLVLGPEVLHHGLLLAVEPSGEADQQELPGSQNEIHGSPNAAEEQKWAASGMAVSVSTGRKPCLIDFEMFTRNRINVPNMLVRAGTRIACIPADTGLEAHEDFRRQMAELVKCGLDPEAAKKAMTIHPAEALGLDYRLGSLDKGKDANLLILDGDVLDPTTTIHAVMIEGKMAYENPWGKTQ